MADIKKRAERNGKIRRTISHIEQTIAKLERMKIEYMQKAVDAKARGESASYSLAKSGLNATLTQIKRAKEMQLNIEITAELQKMGETNADFLTAMSTIAKRISKINKQSDFVKLQKEIQTALSGMEEAQAGLDGFLQNTDAAFASISSTAGALTDTQIDRLIDGKVSEKELLMDEQIEKLLTGGNVSKPSVDAAACSAEVPVGASDGDIHAENGGNAERTETLVAKPFPSPNGEFNFKPKRSAPIADGFLDGIDDGINRALALKDVLAPTSEPTVILGTNGDGDVVRVPFSAAPHILVGGMIGSGKSNFVHQLVCSIIFGFGADSVKFVMVDVGDEELSVYNGIPHMAADAVTDAQQIQPALDALVAEMNRRYDKFAQAGLRDIKSYNAQAKTSMPYIVLVIDEFSGVANSKAFETSYNALSRQSADAGIFTVMCTRDLTAKNLSPAIKVGSELIVSFKTSNAVESKNLLGDTGAEELTGAGDLTFKKDGGLVRCVCPHISKREINGIVRVLGGDVL